MGADPEALRRILTDMYAPLVEVAAEVAAEHPGTDPEAAYPLVRHRLRSRLAAQQAVTEGRACWLPLLAPAPVPESAFTEEELRRRPQYRPHRRS
jgi:hypothetical protein